MRQNTVQQPAQNGRGGFLSSRIDKMSLRFILPLVSFYAVIGLLLILLNDLVNNVASFALASGLVVLGGWLLLRYFRSDTAKRIAGTDLAIGLILLLAGILMFCSPSDLKEVFPKIWGLSLFFGSFLKIQYAFDEKTVGVRRWWIMLVFAAVSLAIGILALLNKSVFGDNQHLFIGIFMIGEAILDLTTYLVIRHGMKKQDTLPAPAVPAAPVPDVPAEPAPVQTPKEDPEPEQQPEA